jgi:signal transduction histidine kinase
LLLAIDEHRVLNGQQMDNTIAVSNRLNALMSAWAVVLILSSTVILIVGSIKIWWRMFRPSLELAAAAERFGRGDLQARAPVLRDDEMGELTRTFNAMAAAIDDRERDRLHFIATIAHDLKNPLVVIGGAASLLKRKSNAMPPDERLEWLGKIEQYTWRLEAMIADLTDSVQIATGRLALNRQELDFSRLVAEVVHDQASTTETHVLHCHTDGDCPLWGDRKRLERVVNNLLTNAIKYSPGGCAVTTEVHQRGGQAVLTVRDQGVGIAPDDLQKLFTPFARLDRTRDMAKGTGLGLSSAKKIVEAHGGTIGIQSELGVGTVVEVCLPLAAPDRLPDTAAAGANGHKTT